jgi:hypothetical protein
MSALFNFQSLLTVIILMICTCAYIRSFWPSILDRWAGERGGIQIQSGQWIRKRIRRAKMTEISCFEVLDVLFEGLRLLL